MLLAVFCGCLLVVAATIGVRGAQNSIRNALLLFATTAVDRDGTENPIPLSLHSSATIVTRHSAKVLLQEQRRAIIVVVIIWPLMLIL
jgi:hypothetical protein